jgi:AraC family transcriptional regulator of adaptative response/methylated-DNA-[protein]-cysteine methyltransferase
MPSNSSKETEMLSPTPIDELRWTAIVSRDRQADGTFFYAVRTTGVFCRPSCPARLPKRENVAFYVASADAEAAGFRPCKRCHPTEFSQAKRHAELVAQACRTIEAAETPPALATLARAAALSPYHFHRVFKQVTGVTIRAYAQAHRGRRVRRELDRAGTVTAAIYDAGFNSGSRFYENADGILGMTPTSFRKGGDRTIIRFAVGESVLGSVLVAATDKGVCAIFLGDDPDALVRELQDRFDRAELIGGDAQFEAVVAKVVGFVERPEMGLDLPLDIRGTAFQRRVWEALRAIGIGDTVSYGEIAARIGKPNAVRAVAGACAANALAVAIPCHRVVRTDGSLGGYRWGVELKETLLNREARA